MPGNSSQTLLSLQLRTRAAAGVVFFSKSGSNYLLLEVVNGDAVLRYSVSGRTLSLTSSFLLDDGYWHRVDVVRNGRNADIILDRGVQRTSTTGTPGSDILSLGQLIYVGGVPDDVRRTAGIAGSTLPGFDGCISNVEVNGISLDLRGPETAVNVTAGCPGRDVCRMTDCGHDRQCFDAWERADCVCLPGFEGTNCTININECAPAPCLNGGTCADRINGYTCSCPKLWLGARCEVPSDCTSSPCQNGASCFDAVGTNYSCTCQPGFWGSNCDRTCQQGQCSGVVSCSQENGSQRTCSACAPGFQGVDCTKHCDQGNCLGVVSCRQLDGGARVCLACRAGMNE